MTVVAQLGYARRILCSAFLLALAALGYGDAIAAPPQVIQVRLSQGLALDLPHDWAVEAAGTRLPVSEWVAASVRSANAPANLNFEASLVGSTRRTLAEVKIGFIPDHPNTQQESREATPDVVRRIDAAIREAAENSLRPPATSGGRVLWHSRVLKWTDTKKVSINGITGFLAEYQRSTLNGKPVDVKVLHVFDGPRSFILEASSFAPANQSSLAPILDAIIRSLRPSATRPLVDVLHPCPTPIRTCPKPIGCTSRSLIATVLPRPALPASSSAIRARSVVSSHARAPGVLQRGTSCTSVSCTAVRRVAVRA